ncbi:MAG: TM2 domain-containing protein [Gemmatimonadetes bacterium]|nr:TM2 domain-containing protein [Gemmatimonadota bacterium]
MTTTQPTKSIGVAILLWWFTGLFGGHRFYLEREHAKTMLALGIGGFVLLGLGIVGLLPFLFVGAAVLAAVGVWELIDVFSLSRWVRESGTAAQH